MTVRELSSVLVIEDNPGDARLLQEMLNEPPSERSLTHVGTMLAAEVHLAQHTADVILLDLGLPDAQALDAVRRARTAAPRVPLVVLTGMDDEELAVQALKEGAQDYLIKGQIDTRSLLRALRYAMERHALEEALFIEKERAQVTLKSMGEGVVCTDIRGNITFLNVVAEAMTGWPLYQAAGRPIREILPILDAASRQPLESPFEVHEDPSLAPLLSILVRRNGLEIAIEGSAARIRDRTGRPTGAVVVFRDVTTARATSQELERSNRELEDFASIASHDLQEPLRKIQAFGDRLTGRHGLDETGQDYLGRMTAAAARMQLLIEGLLAYSRIGTQGQVVVSVPMASVLIDVLSDLEQRLRDSLGEVRIDGTLPSVDADPMQLRQLMQNLIGNALKYRRAEVAPLVNVSCTESAAGWAIEVTDNGIGFAQEQAGRIFAPFQRLHGRHEYDGTGMGLAICRRIVERHHGTIEAHGSPGSGARFVVTLPRIRSDLARPAATATAQAAFQAC